MTGLIKKSVLLLASILISSQLMALGLGEISLDSALNQPLKAEIQLLDASTFTPEELRPRMASQADFDRAGIDRLPFLNSVRIEVSGNKLLLSTRTPISEPFLNFLIELNWPTGRVLREYTLLLDPPTYTDNLVSPLVSAPVTQKQTPTSPVTTEASTEVRDSKSAPWNKPTQPGKYRVKPGDTLWDIAQETLPEGAYSTRKMMLALQEANPNAFINNNINLVKAHTVLDIPDAQSVNSISDNEANREIARQTKAWSSPNATVAQLDATDSVPASKANTGDQTSGEVRLVSANNSVGANNSTGSSSDSIDGSAEDKLSVVLEQLDESKRENQDLTQRLDMLAEQLEQAQRLLTLQNAQLAQLQGQELSKEQLDALESASSVEDGGSTANELATSSTDLEGQMDAQANASETDDTAVQPSTDVSELESEQGAKEEAVPESSVAKPAPLPIRVKEPSLVDMLMENIQLVLIGLASIVLLVALAFYFVNKRREAEEEEAFSSLDNEDYDASVVSFDEDDELTDSDIFGSDSEEDLEVTLTEDAVDASESVTEEESDPLSDLMSEYDVCIAYGKFDQAIDLINSAINDYPERIDLRLKLLEVLASLDEAESFAKAETELHALKDESASQKAIELRSQLSNPISVDMLDVEDEADNEFEVNLPENESVDEQEFLDGIDFDEALSLGDIIESSDADAEDDEESKTELDDGEDFDFNFDEVTISEDLDSKELEPTEEIDLDEGSGEEIDLDLELDLGSDAKPSGFESEYEEDIDLEKEETIDIESSAVVEDLAAPEVEELEDTSALLEEMDTSLDDMLEDFSDNSMGLDISEEPKEALSDDQVIDSPETDLSLEEFDFDEDQVDTEVDVSESDNSLEDDDSKLIGGIDLDELAAADDEFDFLEGTDESGTKLDLARAYIDMDDFDGARELLQEVSQEGNDEQKKEARNLMDNLS